MHTNIEKIKEMRHQIFHLNKKFHDRSLISELFYNQLQAKGLGYKKCLLIYIAPDSGDK